MTDAQQQQVVRELAEQYAELAADPRQDELRRLWTAHNSLRSERTMVLVSIGYHNVWCREVFGDDRMQCEDPFWRAYERLLRMHLFHGTVGDDWIFEPWLSVPATHASSRDIHGGAWGVPMPRIRPDQDGGAWKGEHPLKTLDDRHRLLAPQHAIDETATAARADRLREAVDGVIAVDVERGPALRGFGADLSTTLGGLRGIESFMFDLYDEPAAMKELMAFLRDGVLENQRQAEAAGDWRLSCHQTQGMPYADRFEPPRANSEPVRRRDLWGFFAAQEWTLVGPALHDEFLLQYQLPIMAEFGLTHYGCCEDLTQKIGILRQVPNLRSIAVAPLADVAVCAESMGSDYVMSWRPNPAHMVCFGYDEDRIRKIVGESLTVARDCPVTIHLKDVETVEGDPGRLERWTALVREIIEQVG